MKKITILIIICLLMTFVMPVFAKGSSDDMVYASVSEQNKIYEMITSDAYDGYAYVKYHNYEYIKESITPVYTLDVYEFAEKGTVNLVPRVTEQYVGEKLESGRVYVVKYVDVNKSFRGNEFFVVTSSGVAFLCDEIVVDDPNISNPVSCSYADHAERVKNVLNTNGFVSTTNVRFVTIEGIGSYFYVSQRRNNGFFSVSYETNENQKLGDMAGKDPELITVSELQKYAGRYVKEREEAEKKAEEYLKAHPGSQVIGGPLVLGCMGPCSGVKDIYNINEYLAAGAEQSNGAFPIVIAGSSILTIALVTPTLWRLKKKGC